MIHQVNSIQDQYDAIYITRNLNLGYTYFAFYTPFDPADFIGQAKWHQDGFTQVKQYNHYFFEDFPRWRDITLDNAADLFNNEVDTILVVIDREPVNQIKTEFSIIDWRSRWLWAGWKTDTAGAYQEISKLAINPERAKVLKYLESCLARECDEVWLQVN